MINPEVFRNTAYLKEGLKAPFLIIPNALIPERAEQLYEELIDAPSWKHEAISTNSGFVYERDAIRMDAAGAPLALKELYSYLSSKECLDWMTDISGRDCDGFFGSAALFRPGDQISEHNDHKVIDRADGAKAVRSVTFNYYLTRNWDRSHGGNFVWKTPRESIVPAFNTLVLFRVGPDSSHWVEPISEGVTQKRLSISGWFLSALLKPQLRLKKLNLKV